MGANLPRTQVGGLSYLWAMRSDYIDELNRRGAAGQPFYFLLDYKGEELVVDDLSGKMPFYLAIDGEANRPLDHFRRVTKEPLALTALPESFERYRERFEVIREGLLRGDSYLANLTVRTPVHFTGDPIELLSRVRAKYAVWLPGRFVCFSPEIFVRVSPEGVISSYPMKGTIDATIPNAREQILEDQKELAESATIVDLIRNDLSSVATGVRVERFRYVDEVRTSKGALLQVSSEVAGQLPDDWRSRLGEILDRLLPAGSITGAPKGSTQALIARAEQHERGFYTGICGHFDGESLDTGVLIRFIEREGDRFYYHAGGGITINSDCRSEYEEVIEKIYLPIDD